MNQVLNKPHNHEPYSNHIYALVQPKTYEENLVIQLQFDILNKIID